MSEHKYLTPEELAMRAQVAAWSPNTEDREASVGRIIADLEAMRADRDAMRAWIKGASQFLWVHDRGCPKREGDGNCTCGLDEFLGRPRPFVESYKAELDRLRKALEWYAEPRTWNQWLPDSAGDRARQALKRET